MEILMDTPRLIWLIDDEDETVWCDDPDPAWLVNDAPDSVAYVKAEEIETLNAVVLKRDKQIESLQADINRLHEEIGGWAQQCTEADTVIESLRSQIILDLTNEVE